MNKVFFIAIFVMLSVGISQQPGYEVFEAKLATYQTLSQDIQGRLAALNQEYDGKAYKQDVTFQTDSLGTVTSFVFGQSVSASIQQMFNDNISKFSPAYFTQTIEEYKQDFEGMVQADSARTVYPTARLEEVQN